jgi:cation diffusion facilitator family transporter
MSQSYPAYKPADDLDHHFGQHTVRPAERRMLVAVALALVMMVVEILAGWWSGSLALLADGIHMASHVGALGLSAAAYALVRKLALDRRLSFGAGKINALAGFASALLLGLMALAMCGAAILRAANPVNIATSEALVVAIAGLAVNLLTAWLLVGVDHGHAADGQDEHDHHHHHHDHNLRGALLHVLADALTSVAAIVAIVAAGQFGWLWADPLVAFVGGIIVLRWAAGLARSSGLTLLDREAPEPVRSRVSAALNAAGATRILDMHLWSVGTGALTLVAVVEAPSTLTTAALRSALPKDLDIHHPVIEIRPAGVTE